MIIAIAQLNYTIGDFDGNSAKIIAAIKDAKQQKASLIVFSELALCGYPPDDLLDYPIFIDKHHAALRKIINEVENETVVIGGIAETNYDTGRKLHNAAYVIKNKSILNIVYKTLLPTYDVFSEARYFEPNRFFETVNIENANVAITVCEDLWTQNGNFTYRHSPLDELSLSAPDLVINIAASPFDASKQTLREDILSEQAKKANSFLLYANQVGAHSDLLFDGNSLVANSKGEVVYRLNAFEEQVSVFNLDDLKTALIQVDNISQTEKVFKAVVCGIRDYIQKSGFEKVVLGSSGGIDSAVVQAMATEALGSNNVVALLMPSRFSTEGSILHAKQLSENLGNEYHILPIDRVFTAYEETLGSFFENLAFDITEENLQARTRGMLLMAFSNKFRYFLLNTSNKSEMAVGYSTLYGDMCGGLSPLGDVYKTGVYALADFINRNEEIIPTEIISKAPSAELRHDQKDSDSLPDYDLLDKILVRFIEQQKGTEEIIEDGFDLDIVKKIVQMVNRNEYKRHQSPPILRVSPKSFGRGRVMPLVAKYPL